MTLWWTRTGSERTSRLLHAVVWAGLTGLPLALSAAGPRYTFQLYRHREGLGNLNVRSLFQDRQGFLWIGTDNGLFRFDGERFRSFRTEQGLPNAHISAIATGCRRIQSAVRFGIATETSGSEWNRTAWRGGWAIRNGSPGRARKG